ncbi:MAG: hypothetical protein WCG25_00815 [bacterium]
MLCSELISSRSVSSIFSAIQGLSNHKRIQINCNLGFFQNAFSSEKTSIDSASFIHSIKAKTSFISRILGTLNQSFFKILFALSRVDTV